MAHESGRVNFFRQALVQVRLSTGDAIVCVVDTGFDGSLMLPVAFAEQVQISILGELGCEMVGGTRMSARFGVAYIQWLDELKGVEVLLNQGNDALIGTELLAGTRLNIDYLTRIITISK